MTTEWKLVDPTRMVNWTMPKERFRVELMTYMVLDTAEAAWIP